MSTEVTLDSIFLSDLLAYSIFIGEKTARKILWDTFAAPCRLSYYYYFRPQTQSHGLYISIFTKQGMTAKAFNRSQSLKGIEERNR